MSNGGERVECVFTNQNSDAGSSLRFVLGLGLLQFAAEAAEAGTRDGGESEQYAKTPDQEAQAASMLQHLDFLEQNPGAQSASATSSPEAIAERTTAPAEAPVPSGMKGAKRELPRDVPSIHWPANLGHVEGVAKSFECGAKGQRLHVTVEGKEMVFDMGDPKQVIVRNAAHGVLRYAVRASEAISCWSIFRSADRIESGERHGAGARAVT